MSEETKDPKDTKSADTKASANQKPPENKPPETKAIPTKTFRNVSTSPIELDFGKDSYRVNPNGSIKLNSDQVAHHTYQAVKHLLIEVQETQETKTEAK